MQDAGSRRNRLTPVDMRIAWPNVQHMSKMLQVRNVPDDLHRTLKVRAAENGMTLSDYVLSELEAIAGKPTLAELMERISSRPGLAAIDGDIVVDIIRQHRGPLP